MILGVTRNLRIGGVSKEMLISCLGEMLEDGAWELVRSPEFTVDGRKGRVVKTIVLTLEEFGYGEDKQVSTKELLNPIRLAEWSRKNAEHLYGYVVELLPAEAGLHMRAQWYDDEEYRPLHVAMEPLVTAGGDAVVFCLGVNNEEKRWIIANPAPPHGLRDRFHRFVFQMRRPS